MIAKNNVEYTIMLRIGNVLGSSRFPGTVLGRMLDFAIYLRASVI
jgi:hypothetical protein